MKAAQQSLAVRGTLIAIGLGAEEYPIDAVDLLQNGKVIESSLEGDADPLEFIPRMLGMADELDLDRLITPYPFDQINEAIADSCLRQGGQARAGVVMTLLMTRLAMSTTGS